MQAGRPQVDQWVLTLEFTHGWRVLGFILSFVVAALIYYLIETPIRLGRVLAGRQQFLGLAAVLSILTISGSLLISRNEGLPGRFVPEVAEILAFRNDVPVPFQACEHLGATVEMMCGLGAKAAPREVLVIGDSHALALSGASDLWLAGEGRGGALIFHHGCMPVLGAGSDQCQQSTQSALSLAERSQGVKEVVLVSIWRQALPEGGKPFDGRWVPETEVAKVFASRLGETVWRLQAAGKRVTIVEPLFAAAREVPSTLAGNIAFGRDWPVDVSLAEHLSTFAPVFAAFDTLENVRRVSLIEPFCDGDTCHAVVDGRPLFTDNNHLAFSQSARVAVLLTED